MLGLRGYMSTLCIILLIFCKLKTALKIMPINFFFTIIQSQHICLDKAKDMSKFVCVRQFWAKNHAGCACFSFLKPLFICTSRHQQMYDLAFALHLGLWGQWSFCVWILCRSEPCHCSEQLGVEDSSLRREMLSKPPLASGRAVNMFYFPRSEVSILLPPSVLWLLLKNCRSIASLSDVHS